MNQIKLTIILCALSVSCWGQDSVNVMFYNVENLFDTKDDPKIKDEEYLPSAKKAWDKSKYKDKLGKLAKVISSADDELPLILGVCEIENEQVLRDLAKTKALKKGKYDVAHIDSPDRRGIDVGLLYNKKKFTVLKKEALTVRFKLDTAGRTRDILYVQGTYKKDTLHFFVNHWPSRRGGEKKSQHRRITAASVLRAKIDKIQETTPDAKIIVMGDFNDYPSNKSLKTILRAESAEHGGPKTLFNFMAKTEKAGEGSHNYRGHWGALDQFVVSRVLMSADTKFSVKAADVSIIKKDWMLYHDKKHDNYKPNRTFVGSKYVGGYSDHLPILMKLCYHKK